MKRFFSPGKGVEFSVVIPTRNRASVLQMCLQAFKGQNFPKEKFEVIVVDDGSTDGTKAVVEKHGFDYIFQRQDGACSARNRGIEKAKGRFVCLLADDQVVAKDWLLERHKAHKKYPDDALVGPSYPHPKAGPGFSSLQSETYNELADGSVKESNWLCCYNTSLLKSWFDLERFDERFKGSGIEDQLPFDSCFSKEDKLAFSGEDIELGYRLRQRGLKIRLVEGCKALHFHPSSFEQHLQTLEARIKHDYIVEKLHPVMALPYESSKGRRNWFCRFNEVVCGELSVLKAKNYNAPKSIFPGVVTIATVFFGKQDCLEKYLRAIDSLKLDKKNCQLLFCDYSKSRRFGVKLAEWLKERRDKYKLVLYDKIFEGSACTRYLNKVKESGVGKVRFREIERAVLLDKLRKSAAGDFILFVGDDILLPRDCLEKLMKQVNKKGVAIAGGRVFGRDSYGGLYPLVWNFLHKRGRFPRSNLLAGSVLPNGSSSEFVSAVSLDCCLVRNSVVDSLGLLPESADGRLFGTELVLGLKAAEHGKKVVVDWSVDCKRALVKGTEKKLKAAIMRHNLQQILNNFEKEAAEKEKLLKQFDEITVSTGWKVLSLVHEIKKRGGWLK